MTPGPSDPNLISWTSNQFMYPGTVLQILCQFSNFILTANICEEFLKREWMSADGQKEKGVRYNENLQIIIR